MLPQPPPPYAQPPYGQQPYTQNLHKPMSVPINQYTTNHNLNSNPVQIGYSHIHGN